jgi:hypothetical protein
MVGEWSTTRLQEFQPRRIALSAPLGTLLIRNCSYSCKLLHLHCKKNSLGSFFSVIIFQKFPSHGTFRNSLVPYRHRVPWSGFNDLRKEVSGSRRLANEVKRGSDRSATASCGGVVGAVDLRMKRMVAQSAGVSRAADRRVGV